MNNFQYVALLFLSMYTVACLPKLSFEHEESKFDAEDDYNRPDDGGVAGDLNQYKDKTSQDIETSCLSLAYQKCWPQSGKGGDVWWFDSCEQPEERALDCPDENSECLEEAGSAKCQCSNHWQGVFCDQCPANWDPEKNCAECLPGWGGEKCEHELPEIEWIEIQGGSFDMGSEVGQSNERPIHTVHVPTFSITKTEVTVTQYWYCVQAEVCPTPREDLFCNLWCSKCLDDPANCIDWYEANAFCQFINGRLPSEAEWEYAARSGGKNISYPWGDTQASCEFAVMDEGDGTGCGMDSTGTVCSKPEGNTDQGLCDMAGNVSEWVADDYHSSYNNAPLDGSAWLEEDICCDTVLRGGDLTDIPYDLVVTRRWKRYRRDAWPGFGFRCAR